MSKGKITKEDVIVLTTEQLLKRLIDLAEQKSQGYSTGLQFFIDTVNNQVIPEMEKIIEEIKSRVK